MSKTRSVFVIMRETGEYSYRDFQPIRYVLTKEEAEAAVERADLEKKFGNQPPYVRHKTHGFFDDTGREWEFGQRPVGVDVQFRAYTNAEELTRENERLEQEYTAACLAMGNVDPRGCVPDASYFYEEVTLYAPAQVGRHPKGGDT